MTVMVTETSGSKRPAIDKSTPAQEVNNSREWNNPQINSFYTIQNEAQTRVVDERNEIVNLLDKPDLVVIMAHYANAARAYVLADFYRARGVFVMLMGSHVTSFPGEACEHADAIFIGPWDGAFTSFIEDFQQGKKRRLYCAPTPELFWVNATIGVWILSIKRAKPELGSST